MVVSGNRGNRRFQEAASVSEARGATAKKKFVILAVTERLGERAAFRTRDFVGVNAEPCATGPRHPREISGETVAQVHHGADAEMGDKPLGRCEARLETNMPSASERPSQAARDVQHVPHPASAPRDTPFTRHLSHHADREPAWPRRGSSLPTDHVHAERPRGASDPGVNLPGPFRARPSGQRERHQRMNRRTAGRRDVAQRSAERLPTDTPRLGAGGKMYSLDDAIRL